jgi:type IV secretory pathway TraG/TraD family ATPase VirD4
VARYGKEHRARFFLPHLRWGSYNPFRYGNPTELADRLVSEFDWSEQFYKNTAKEFLLGVFRALVAGNKEFTLADVCEVTTNLRALQRLIAETPDVQAKRILSPYAVKGDKREVLSGLAAQLSVIVHSSYGEMLNSTANDLDFRTAHTKGMFFYVSLPVTAASEFFPSLGKLMIADLNALNSAIASGAVKKYGGVFSVVIDEFSSFVTPQFVSLISQARSQNFAVTIAHQTLADLQRLSEEAQLAVMGNTNIKMAFRLEVPADAETLAKMAGTRQVLEQTYQTEQGFLGEGLSGRGSVKSVEEYVIHPNVIKRLGTGETAFIRKSPLTYSVVHVTRAWQPESDEAGSQALRDQLFERRREEPPPAWNLTAPLPAAQATAELAAPKSAALEPPKQDDEPAARPSKKNLTHGGDW